MQLEVVVGDRNGSRGDEWLCWRVHGGGEGAVD